MFDCAHGGEVNDDTPHLDTWNNVRATCSHRVIKLTALAAVKPIR